MTDEVRAFLKEYFELCEKHGTFVSGCGCCSSPFLEGAGESMKGHPDKGERLANHIAYMLGVDCKKSGCKNSHYTPHYRQLPDGKLVCAECGTDTGVKP